MIDEMEKNNNGYVNIVLRRQAQTESSATCNRVSESAEVIRNTSLSSRIIRGRDYCNNYCAHTNLSFVRARSF